MYQPYLANGPIAIPQNRSIMPVDPPPSFRRAPQPIGVVQTASAPATSRLNKRMAELGLCSRREADEWIAKGWVKVNGQAAIMGKQV